MFRNYIITAVRNLLRNKFYTSINIAGLAIGLSVGIMILLWVQDELSYNKFHSKADRIFKVNSHLPAGDAEQVWEDAPSPIAVHASKKIPEVEKAVRVRANFDNYLFGYGEKTFAGFNLAYADPSFFSLFDFKFLSGSAARPFEGSHSVVLTSSIAKRFFGDQDPIGKILQADKRDNFKVTAVIEDFPSNSTINYSMIFPMSLNAERFGGNGEWKTIDEDLGNFNYSIYLLLKPDASPEVVGKKVTGLYRDMRSNEPNMKTYYTLQALTDLHLYAADGNSRAMQTVKIFVLVSIFILIIACINYVNLATARSIVRSKEVSVRKIIGARKSHLFIQFLLESGILFLLSTVAAFVIIRLLLPLYNDISGKQLVFNLGSANVWLVLLTAVIGSLAVASIYPAILLSSFRPIESLKGKFTAGIGNAGFRKALVVTQFVFSIGLIISTMVIGLQLKYMREKDLGYDKEHVFSFNIRDEMMNHYPAIRSELLQSPGVVNVSRASSNIIGVSNSTSDTDWDGKDPNRAFIVHPTAIDEQFVPLFNIKMVAGKNFTGSKSDSAHILLNETAVRESGIKDPIGKRFSLWGAEGRIIGVVKDFNYASLKEKIEPAVYYYNMNYGWRLFIKTNGRDADKAIAAAQKQWMKYSADYPFNYVFVDEEYDSLYKTEQRTGTLFNVFAVVAIIISCLGLFGLATYTAYVKKKEIGIRKVLGAGITNITTLLTKDFIVLVLISLFIAIPVAWWAMSNWLQDFVYRISLSWDVFAISGALAIGIALITVSFQSIKAALANPVNSLKEE